METPWADFNEFQLQFLQRFAEFAVPAMPFYRQAKHTAPPNYTREQMASVILKLAWESGLDLYPRMMVMIAVWEILNPEEQDQISAMMEHYKAPVQGEIIYVG